MKLRWSISIYFLLTAVNWLQIMKEGSCYDKSLNHSSGSLRLQRMQEDESRFDYYYQKSSNLLTEDQPIRIVVFSVWVGAHPLNETIFNHRIYCDRHGYTYRHFYLNERKHYQMHGDGTPHAWLSVFSALQLLEENAADYYLKLDVDCIFARMDLRLEWILDPKHRYSFYATEIVPSSRFIQSHAYLFKQGKFAIDFFKYWASFHDAMFCANIAYEQGALQFTLGYFMNKYYSHLRRLTDYECQNYCHLNARSAFTHHHCVLDWFTENHLGCSLGPSCDPREDHPIQHPEIFIDVFPPAGTAYSPEDGWTFQLGRMLRSDERPLTVHPCKRGYYTHPEHVMDELASICTVTAR